MLQFLSDEFQVLFGSVLFADQDRQDIGQYGLRFAGVFPQCEPPNEEADPVVFERSEYRFPFSLMDRFFLWFSILTLFFLLLLDEELFLEVESLAKLVKCIEGYLLPGRMFFEQPAHEGFFNGR